MKVFWRFFKYLKPYIKPLAAANFFMLLFVIFSLASIGLVMPFIDLLFNPSIEVTTPVNFSLLNLKEWLSYQLNEFVQSYSKLELVTYLCVLIIIVFFFKNLFSYLQTWFMSFVEQGIIRDIRLQLYTHFHKLSLGYFTEEKKGILISRIINDVQIIKDSMIAVINSIFRDPPLIIIF
jgi:subfamily B ATP-binding cassette protein MsbA